MMKIEIVFKKGMLDSRTAGINECRMSPALGLSHPQTLGVNRAPGFLGTALAKQGTL